MKQNETYLDYVIRITRLTQDGLLPIEEWGKKIIGEDLYGQTNLKRCLKFFTRYLDKLEENKYNNIKNSNLSKDDLEKIIQAKDELIKERKKIQTVNIEYNANQRAEARSELFYEKIIDSINNLPKIKFSNNLDIDNQLMKNVGVLCISDAHNGVEINMDSLFGEKVNVYSPDILKARLNKLLNDLENSFYDEIEYDKLIVFDLGDAIQNYLRLSDIAKVKTGVVESTIQYAEMISNFLNELSNRLQIPIEYFCLGGNHSEMRLLNGKRNFDEENLGKIIREFIYLRLKNNKNIKVNEYSEFAFTSLFGTNILAIHGDYSQDAFNEISYWENYHNISIDILLMGHFHHKEEISVSYGNLGDKEVIKVPSLIGIDAYSKKRRKMARAGAKFMIFNENGKNWEKVYYLN